MAETKHAIEHDIFDAETFAEAREAHAKLDETAVSSAEKLLTAPDLIQDTFLSLYQPRPQLAGGDEMAPTHKPNHEIVAQMMGTREWADLRTAGTVSDEMGSAFASATIAHRIIDALSEIDRENMNDLARLSAEVERLNDEAEMFDEFGQEYQRPDLIERAHKQRDAAAVTQKSADDCVTALAESSEARGDAVRRAIRVAAEQTAQQLGELNDALEAFGSRPGYGAGDGRSQMTTKEKLDVAKRLRKNPRLGQLAQIVGRYVNVAMAVQRSKVENVPSEIASVTRGNDLAHALPSELALLADPVTENIFYHRFGERALQQYKLHANEKVGRGPLIVATDESASMTAKLGDVTRDTWAKALALALLSVARKQKRDFAWLHFASGAELKATIFKGGEATVSATIAAADHFFAGGTDYAGWMAKSLELVNGSQFEKADVVLLSDGEAHIAEAAKWNEARQRRGMRCYAILIGAESKGTLDEISDRVFSIDDLSGESEVLRTIFAV